MRMQRGYKNALTRIMVLGSSLAAGFATASLEALQANFAFQVTTRTLLAFATGFLLLLGYWKILFNPSQSPRQKRLRSAVSILLFLGGLVGFLYPLRYIARNKISEVISGLIMAFVVLSGVVLLLFIIKRFLDEDTRNNQ